MIGQRCLALGNPHSTAEGIAMVRMTAIAAMSSSRVAALFLLASVLVTASAAAQERGSVSVAIDGKTVKLSTVTYKPAGDGPFPTLIFHHGARSHPPDDPKAVVEWFVERGWAVIAPSRRGYGGSEGWDDEGPPYRCSEQMLEGADRALGDIEAVTPALIAQPFVDRSRIAVGGQGRGGLLSVAWSGKHPEVRAVVNFVGGWANTITCRQAVAINGNLLNRGITWGQPSIWLYSDKNTSDVPEDARTNFDAFLAAGGKAVFYTYVPPEGGELNGYYISMMPQLWTADMEAYFAERGLPSKRAN
jgi:dienelactone hydrolase